MQKQTTAAVTATAAGKPQTAGDAYMGTLLDLMSNMDEAGQDTLQEEQVPGEPTAADEGGEAEESSEGDEENLADGAAVDAIYDEDEYEEDDGSGSDGEGDGEMELSDDDDD